MKPVFARHAASLLLWRRGSAGLAQGASGIEVLMGVRGAGHRFMPNRLVFPGGAVDAGDAVAPAASEPNAATLALIGRATGGRTRGPRLARAIVMAAARELAEETGLSFGRPPALADVFYLCRAITPPESPIRFNARFLVAEAGLVSGTLADGEEMGALRFYPVAEALEAGVMEVTREVLLRLQAYLAAGAAAPAVYRRRRWERD